MKFDVGQPMEDLALDCLVNSGIVFSLPFAVLHCFCFLWRIMPKNKKVFMNRDINKNQTAKKSDKIALSPRASELLQEKAVGLPVWIRSPKAGNEFYSGFSRSKLYELATEGKIGSRSIRKPGQVKGTRLFKLQSILEFIEGCPAVEAVTA